MKTILQVTHGEAILINDGNIQVWKAPKWITLVAVNEITGNHRLPICFNLTH